MTEYDEDGDPIAEDITAPCEACDGFGWVEDPTACGDPDHCCPVMICRRCEGGDI